MTTSTTLPNLPTTTQKASFANFDKRFQEKIVQAMLWDKSWAAQFAEVLHPEWFDHQYLTLVTNKYLGFYRQYRTFPSLDLLLSLIKDHLKNSSATDQLLKAQLSEFFRWIVGNPDLQDLKYVQETSMDWCKRQALKAALEESCDLVFTEQYESVANVIKKALCAGTTSHTGLNLLEDIDSRYEEAARKCIPTGVPEFDQRKIFNGGLATGEIGIVVAPSGVGKSHLMIAFGAAGLLAGKNVLHYTFELRDNLVGIRYDSHLTGIPSLECWEHREDIRQYYRDNKDNLGRLFIKEYPTSTATCQTLRGHLEKLAVNHNFRPDLVIVDYMGIMRSTDKYDAPRFELKRIAEELRALSSDLAVPVWTCVQSNKEGANSDTIDSTNLAESYGQAAVADVIISLQRKSSERATGYGNVFIAKNRAGIDGIQFQIHLDTARSRLRVLTDAEALDYESLKHQEENEGRARVKNVVSTVLKKAMQAGQNHTGNLAVLKVKDGAGPDMFSEPPTTPEAPQDDEVDIVRATDLPPPPFLIFPDLAGSKKTPSTPTPSD